MKWPAQTSIFGNKNKYKDSSLIYLPIPWDATTSYEAGTHRGPLAIHNASPQIDLYDLQTNSEPYLCGLHMLKPPTELYKWNTLARKKVLSITKKLNPEEEHPKLTPQHKEVNKLSEKLNTWTYKQSKLILKDHKICAIVGGDHSTPFGALQAISENEKNYGILHFDAHFDLRRAYQGFTHSHASIMYNALESFPEIEKIIQVGIRDFSLEEFEYYKSLEGRSIVYFDSHIQEKKYNGASFDKIADEIVSQLPNKIWISFDIDGLDPQFCPNTGTPVPGGLHFYESLYIIKKAVLLGKKIIGFDLVEVSPPKNKSNTSEWDANVGMRLLYQISAWCLKSQGKL